MGRLPFRSSSSCSSSVLLGLLLRSSEEEVRGRRVRRSGGVVVARGEDGCRVEHFWEGQVEVRVGRRKKRADLEGGKTEERRVTDERERGKISTTTFLEGR